MKLKLTILFLVLLGVGAYPINAQSSDRKTSKNNENTFKKDTTVIPKKKINHLYDGNWSIGVGVNAINDSGKILRDLTADENWNVSKPLTASIEYYANNMFSYALSLSFNEYLADKNIDDTGTIVEDYEASYMAVDFAFKWYWRDFFHSSRFDPFMLVGVGYTEIGAYKLMPFEKNELRDDLDHIMVDENGYYDIPEIGRITINYGIGINLWFTRIWAINFNIVGKFGIGTGEYVRGPNSVSNQMHYSLGTHFLLN